MAGFDNLQRFVDAQSGVYSQVCAELRQGRKVTHWVWFIFPQIAGLGSSPMAARYAIMALDEAQAYLEHPLLGNRLRECSSLVAIHRSTPIERIMGWPDHLKLKSSMTLFSRAAESASLPLAEDAVFNQVLQTFYGGEQDQATLARL